MAKRKTATKQQAAILSSEYRGGKRNQEGNVLNFNEYVHDCRQRSTVVITPKSEKQSEYVDLLNDDSKSIVFATGPAGTGKTMLAVLTAIKAYKEKLVEKIVITRPIVGVDDEQIGHLPGDINEKMAPWTRPIFDIMKQYYRPRELAALVNDEVIELSPLAFMRGRTFHRSFIIADEMQSSSANQMKMLLTRLGENSKMVVTGDLQQTDRHLLSENGLRDFLHLLRKGYSSTMSEVSFKNIDIQRHPVVAEILELYGEV